MIADESSISVDESTAHHTVFTSYCGIVPSLVTMQRPFCRACEIIRRSNGSLCRGGSVFTPSISADIIGMILILRSRQISSMRGIDDWMPSFPMLCFMAISQNETMLTLRSFSVETIRRAFSESAAGLQRKYISALVSRIYFTRTP